MLLHLYSDVVGACWPPERRDLENAYADLPWPLAPLAVPAFAMRADWTLAQLLAYLRTWSAVQRYAAAHGADPVGLVEAALATAWGEAARARAVRWPLTVLAGRVA